MAIIPSKQAVGEFTIDSLVITFELNGQTIEHEISGLSFKLVPMFQAGESKNQIQELVELFKLQPDIEFTVKPVTPKITLNKPTVATTTKSFTALLIEQLKRDKTITSTANDPTDVDDLL